MSFAFTTQPFPFTRKRTSPTRFKMHTSNQSDYSPILSRRTLLLSAGVIAASIANTRSAQSYSSPYKPNESTDNPLPDRLYETTTNKVITTPSGLQYFDILPGEGKEAKDGDTVSVYYTTRLRGLYGIKIQSTSDDPSTPPFKFILGDKDVVPGVNEAIKGMKVGGKRRAVLPPQIAYASPDMKPAVTDFFARRRLLSVLETSRDSTIVFDFELVKVK